MKPECAYDELAADLRPFEITAFILYADALDYLLRLRRPGVVVTHAMVRELALAYASNDALPGRHKTR